MTRMFTRPTESDPSFFRAWSTENHDAGPVVPRPDRGPRRGTRAGAVGVLAAVVATTVSVLVGNDANADPSASTWYRLRMCESSNNYKINTGNAHYGAYQFDLSTWRSVGGSGYPQNAAPAEQDARALILYRLRGWQPWQCAGILGLREDGDARSGRTGDINVATGGSTASSTFPSSGYFEMGDKSALIAGFQKQLNRRGIDFDGTGLFGAKTLAAVKRLQKANGLAVTGRLNRTTWHLAWTGKLTTTTTTPSKPPKPTVTVPHFPKYKAYAFGDRSIHVAAFQRQMNKRGATFDGTGEFGPKTTAVIKRLQRANGIRPNGRLGAVTFRLAWVGKY